MENFNEIMTLVNSYHLFCFTDWIDDGLAIETMGTSMIATILLQSAVNIAVIGYEQMVYLKKTFKLWNFQRINAKVLQKIKEKKAKEQDLLFVKQVNDQIQLRLFGKNKHLSDLDSQGSAEEEGRKYSLFICQFQAWHRTRLARSGGKEIGGKNLWRRHLSILLMLKLSTMRARKCKKWIFRLALEVLKKMFRTTVNFKVPKTKKLQGFR